MEQDLTLVLAFAILALTAAVAWLLACRLGVFSPTVSKWSFWVAGAILTVGLFPLLGVLVSRRRGRLRQDVSFIETVAPTPLEIEEVDHEAEAARTHAVETRVQLAELDAKEVRARDLGVDDPDAGSISQDRVRRLREQPE